MASFPAEAVTPPLTDPPGTCRSVGEGSPWYWVMGDSGEWHLVNAETSECDCRHFVFRCSFRPGDCCKHGRRLARYLEEQNACPVCHGKAFLVPTGAVRYVDRNGKVDMSPLACIACGGSGKRSDGQQGEGKK